MRAPGPEQGSRTPPEDHRRSWQIGTQAGRWWGGGLAGRPFTAVLLTRVRPATRRGHAVWPGQAGPPPYSEPREALRSVVESTAPVVRTRRRRLPERGPGPPGTGSRTPPTARRPDARSPAGPRAATA